MPVFYSALAFDPDLFQSYGVSTSKSFHFGCLILHQYDNWEYGYVVEFIPPSEYHEAHPPNLVPNTDLANSFCVVWNQL